MVLYYKSVEEKVEPHSYPRVELSTSTQSAPIRSLTNREELVNPDRRQFHDEVYKSPFSDRIQLYHVLLQDNFNNLSTDDKLVIMYKTMILKNNTTNNYILMCLCVLVIIAFKLFSK